MLPLLPFPGHWQGDRLEVELPGFDLAPKWDAGTTSGRLVCYAHDAGPMSYIYIFIYFCFLCLLTIHPNVRVFRFLIDHSLFLLIFFSYQQISDLKYRLCDEIASLILLWQNLLIFRFLYVAVLGYFTEIPNSICPQRIFLVFFFSKLFSFNFSCFVQ